MELEVAATRDGLYASAVATFGENLRRARQSRGITQERLAEKLKLKRQSAVSAWERGRRTPRASTIRRIAAAIGCEPTELLEGVETEHDKLRGSPIPTPEKTGGRKLLKNEARALRILGTIPVAGQPDALVAFAFLARQFRHPQPRELDGPGASASSPEAHPKGRKARRA